MSWKLVPTYLLSMVCCLYYVPQACLFALSWNSIALDGKLYIDLQQSFAGDNFFRNANYTIEVMSAEPFSAEKEELRDVEARILTKRAEISKFETEYREVCCSHWLLFNLHDFFPQHFPFNGGISACCDWQVLAKFTEMTSRYTQEMQAVSSCNSGLVSPFVL